MNVVEWIAVLSLAGNVVTVFVTMAVKLEVSKLRVEMNMNFISKKDHRLFCVNYRDK